MIAHTRDWISRPFVWQRVISALLAGPFLAVGAILLATGAWDASLTGSVYLLALWVGFPLMSLGLVFAGAAVLPVGRSRDGILSVVLLLFVASWVLAIVVPILNAVLIRDR